jgi:4'-phosphopantetheinyl transferase EntD
MFRAILPDSIEVEAVSTELAEEILFPEEVALVSQAVASRRQEYVTGRACAHVAMKRLGVASAPILAGDRGEPQWPPGVVGSITHCAGLRACAVGRASEWLSVGIDAEPNAPLPPGLIGDIAVPAELAWLRQVDDGPTNWDRLLFCAKEAIYKAWFPQMRCWLGFEDATIHIDRSGGTFESRLNPAKRPPPSLATIHGRWQAESGLVAASVVCPVV